MFNKHNIYIIASIVIGFLVIILLGWAIFLDKEGKDVMDSDSGTDYLFGDSNNTGNNFESGGSIFGKMVEEIKDAAKKDIDETKKETEFKAALMQLHIAPVAGAYVEANDTLHFVEKSTGHAFELTVGDKITTKRVLHTTVPAVQEAHWVDNGNGVIRRYIDSDGSIATVYGTFPKVGEEAKTGYLADNITALTSSPDGKQLFYIAKDAGVVKGYVSNSYGENPVQIWESIMHQWNVKWADTTRVLITQKPTNSAGGAAFLINSSGTKEEFVISRVPGLITNMNKMGGVLLYSRSADHSTDLRVRDFQKNTDTTISLATFADKCAWSNVNKDILYCFVPKTMPDANYPDAWYQGLVRFTDDLWQVNIETGEAVVLASPEEDFNTEVDTENILMSKSDEYIFFTNKADQTLWAIKIKENE